jgi:hypothetical protein
MRPRGVTLKEMPDTMAWGHSGQCKSCVQPNGPGDRPKPATKTVITKAVTAEADVEPASASEEPATGKDLHLANTVAGLNSFLAARQRRLRVPASRAAAQQPIRRVA